MAASAGVASPFGIVGVFLAVSLCDKIRTMLFGDSREIRRNTFSLYARAAIVAAAHLIATRVVLRELGTTGYGMYCAVASVAW